MTTLRTTDLCDRHGELLQVVEPVFRHFGGRRQFSGPIATIRCPHDNSLVRERVALPGEGRVLVVDGGDWRQHALLGGRLAALAAANGWAGILVNGCVRDVTELAAAQLGVMARAPHPLRTEKRGLGERDVVVAFAGAVFEPGHFLYADEDGIVVSPRPLATDGGAP